ncbi:antichymotrypsin-1-like isoform X1 [Anticarsia gemmatalis]|uniref:antichymotrypsin-1-like isoform X1 n=1 Tax=Anticarsia gemmatalis TaxID=129554 RepID=UPI003F76D63D
MDSLLLLFFAIAGVAAAPEFEFPPVYQRTQLGDSIDVSTMKVLKVAYESGEDKNVVSSPLGLMMLLSLYERAAGPAAKEELARFLGETDAKQSSEWYKDLSVKLSELEPQQLAVAHKIAVSDKYVLDEQFAAAARAYRSELDSVDFSKPKETAALINQWAAEKTKGLIKEPVSADSLTPDIAAALFNVIYFNGHWHVPFKAEDTKEKDFHVSRDSAVKKPMMHLLQSLYYAESKDLGAKMIELPYKEKGFRMVVVLPDQVDGLPSVLEKAAEKGLLSDVFRLSPAGRDIDLDMPKFDIRSNLDFNNILPKVGVSKIFQEAALGLVKDTPVKVSKAFQQAFIKVNEEGATAGAFTGLIAVPMSSWSRPPPPMKFTVDHPFIYAILHEDKIIFAGTYSG